MRLNELARLRRQLAAVAVTVLSIGGLAGCAADEPIDPAAAVFQVSLTSCEPDVEGRAIAVSIGDGLALTVAHSFEGAEGATLTGPDGGDIAAALVYLDQERDIAVLSFDTDAVAPDTRTGLVLRSDAEDPAEVGRIVVRRDGATVIESIDLLRRTEVTLDGDGRRQGIELSGAIERGDSGAPVLDDQNRMIGMVFATSRISDTGWAIAASELETVPAEIGPPIELICP